jgi:hypothetical protein
MGSGGARPGAGRPKKQTAGAGKAAKTSFAGMSPGQIAESVLLQMVDGSIEATAPRVSACREILRLTKRDGDSGIDDIDDATWSKVLGGCA